MSKERLYIFDTTLRDGAQTQGVDFSLEDKEKIASALDNLGVDYIEAGWPGANPTDTEFFQKKHNFKNSKLTCFGMTKRSGRSAENDTGLSALMNSNTPAVCLVGKSWGNPPGIEGSSLKKGDRIILLEDVTTTGGSALKASLRMQEMGCDVVACITILDRQEGGVEAFEKAGIQLLPILLRSDITGE